MIDALINALPHVFVPTNLLAVLIGTVAGLIVGALPGLTVTTGIAVLIPLTFGVDPLFALGMMAGMYNGGSYGGAIPAILLRIPGTPASVATVLDGYALTQQGKAAYALQVAVVSGVIGSVLSAIALILFAPGLATIGLAFSPADYFWVSLLGLATVTSLLGNDFLKGLIAALLGLAIGTIGLDISTGDERYTFGLLELTEGLDLVVLLTALFAFPPVIQMVEQALTTGLPRHLLRLKSQGSVLSQWRQFLPVWLRSSFIGIVIGILPGAGGSMSCYLAYNDAKRRDADPDSFGTGNPKGVAASEAGNGADNASSLIPALTLGIPGSGVAAVILGGLLVQGLRPGPQLFQEHPDIVYGFMLQMLLSALLLAVVGGLTATRLFGQALRLPTILLAPVIMLFITVGVYAVNNSAFDLYLFLGIGLFAYFMEKLDYPSAPIILGVMLGPIAETQLNLALTLSNGQITALASSPLSWLLILLTIFILLTPYWRYLRER
ncbi:C4-dicarboxylate ABC transporter permease [Pectobacterium punjabense]|uniref:C4-dicarboxylate ABC transporter permease n=1 Tax=Pectobacterium punjabense TaxID=2108399 RepID=A0ABX6L3T7_9GAMM|nr:tripartite tricarboxylate transporter permease [Pectobacterium punjabense]MBS4429308.1 tripartite tricarboxylate transporter permease [Pectobacterium punjabense]PTA65123.1 C4-dicarboxylate ABC transporter permease [Pectobacterium punjabense]QJA21003.1 C4-dicarboxylate ABC transporter permease [Pectobacterium punjabense]